METLEVKRDGRIVSTVYFGADVEGVVSLLSGNCFLVYDAAVEGFASVLTAAFCSVPDPASAFSSSFASAKDATQSFGQSSDRRLCGKYVLENVSEENKTISTAQELCRWLLSSGADRDATVVALGGGIVCDLVGFVAAIYKRGVRVVYIPTTLLAQVDAAIGGKTGVNLDSYKNMVGVFRQPAFTYICPQVLETLPPRIFRSGLAEQLKTFIIGNGSLVGRLLMAVRQIDEAGGFREAASEVRAEFGGLVREAAAIKAGIVSRDEFEGGERRKLNLGHTFAHAIEYCSFHSPSDRISHGEAVAMGIAMAARVSVNLGIADPQVEADIINALQICGLPTVCPFPIEALADAMSRDKKAEGGKIHFVLPRSIGDVIVWDLTIEEIINSY